MSDQLKITSEQLFTWIGRLLMIVLTALGIQIQSSFNEMRADVKTLLKEHEEVKTKVEYLWSLETGNRQPVTRNNQ